MFEYLRSQSSETRARYAFVIALIVTGIIALVWSTTLPARFRNLDDLSKKNTPVSEQVGTNVDTTVSQLGSIIASQQTDSNDKEKEETKIDTTPKTNLQNLKVDPSPLVVGSNIVTDLVNASTNTSTSTRVEDVVKDVPKLDENPAIVMPPLSTVSSTASSKTDQRTVVQIATTSVKTGTILIGTTSRSIR